MLNSKTIINNNFNKTYFEVYAALALEAIGEIEKFNIDLILDKPDIQINNIGFEVTRDLSQDEAEQLNYFNKVSGKPKTEKKRILDYIDPNKRSRLREHNDLSVLELDCHGAEIIIEAIKKKNAKIDNYSNFKIINLYIFTSTFMFDLKMTDEVTELLSKVNSGFDNIFIHSHDAVFKYDGLTTCKYDIEDKLVYLAKEAMQLNNKYFDNFGNRLIKNTI